MWRIISRALLWRKPSRRDLRNIFGSLGEVLGSPSDEADAYLTATRRTTRSEEVLYLLHRTIKDLWIEFKNQERPFLVASGRRAEKIRKGDYWGESDVEEKAGAGRVDGMFNDVRKRCRPRCVGE